MTTSDNRPQILTADGAAVRVTYGDTDNARVDVTHDPSGARPGAVADLVCEAVRQARSHRSRHLRTALDAGAPSCGLVLEALRGRVGGDVRSIALRRAGSSVMVTLDLLPAPRRAVVHPRPRP